MRSIGAQSHSVAFSVDLNWTVLLKGSPSSLTKKGKLMEERPDQPGSYQHDVPLMAMRQVGMGRLLFLGISEEYLFGPSATTTLENIVLERGLAQSASDGYKLLDNSLRWLSAPSLASHTLGGAQLDTALLVDPNKTKFGPAFDWTAKARFPEVAPAYSGVIGARTRYSTGAATVDEWVAAAKQQGLAYLVFLEDFAHLTPAAFDRLKADCARLSGQDFVAIPGFTIDDEVGNHYFYFGTNFPYPDKQRHLSADGTVFHSAEKGQLAGVTLDYAFTHKSFQAHRRELPLQPERRTLRRFLLRL